MSDRLISQILVSVLGLTLALSVAAGAIWGLPSFLLGIAAGALSTVIVLMWASLQQMNDVEKMGFEQAMSYAAPLAEEEQKRALLRTLKDLDYELSVGKISRADYDQVSAEVREKAKRVIAMTDETMKNRLMAAEERVLQRQREVGSSEKKTQPKRVQVPSKKKTTTESAATPEVAPGEETK